nr:similar to the subtilase family of serine proteases (Pfam: PF00082, score; 47.5, E=3.8e-12, n=2) [Arabidopsis thaliana]
MVNPFFLGMKSCRTLIFVAIILNGLSTFVAHAGAESKVHIVYLGEKQHDDPEFVTESHHRMLWSLLGSKEDAHSSMVHSYRHGFSGFAAKLTKSQAKKLADLPEVVHVTPDSFYQLDTTRTWDYLGLSVANPKNLLNDTNMGEEVIIGIVDSGVWPESEVFNDNGIGPVPSHWKGGCVSGENFTSSQCNKKLIGAKYFINGFLATHESFNSTESLDFISPRDRSGHGTHVATIAGGSYVPSISYKGLAGGTVRGGAPRARIAMYKACWYLDRFDINTCSSADILKAMDEAMHDGVDVLSLSIGYRFPYFPETDVRAVIATGAFHAVLKGITVVCSGGNSGPAAQTVGNTAPWILTVAATTLDRSFPTPITLGNNKLILIQPSKTLVGQPVGTKVADFSSRGPNSIEPAILKTYYIILLQDVCNLMVLSQMQPDIAAPGVSILAATTTNKTFNDRGFIFLSGTSMAAPTISGVVALLKALHRDWSPAAIRSAIVTTAWRTDPFGEQIFAEGSPRKLADPFDYGGGLVNPEKAAKPGLVYDLGLEDYVLYMCSVGYNETSISQLVGKGTVCSNPKPSVLDFNLPSITIPNLKDEVTLTRTLTNVGQLESVYKVVIEPPIGIQVTVTPETLLFNSTTKRVSFKVKVSTTHKINTGYFFGSLTWSDSLHNVTIPLSVRTQILQNYYDEN